MSSYTLRWGIISTGSISTSFVEDLLTDPTDRKVNDVAHAVTAVGSRSLESAQKFIDKISSTSKGKSWAAGVNDGRFKDVKPYGDYQGVFDDANVDAVYIGTPHIVHHRNAKDALLAGKHVLCEKPFTLDRDELDELIAIAKEKKLFLMEAVWTRFQPIAYAIEEVLKSGKLGKPKRFWADFSMDWGLESTPHDAWMMKPEFGGGSLLDSSAYPSVWAMLCVHRHPLNTIKEPKVVNTHQTLYKPTGVDKNSRWLVEWDGFCLAALTTDLDSSGLRDATAVLQCEEGDLVIPYPPYKPTQFTINPKPDGYLGSITEKTTYDCPLAPGVKGWAYEADEVARCVKAGKLESERMPWEESQIVQGWVDEVRKNGPSKSAGLKGTAGQ
ncbi:hypothetical protein L198_08193 [Cryptococcus wingfieldii CBS 7118]|uniref:D-xylose 1-dehydrogenase (NADP(+), D-xylono-1,5-lactone-forming) n=1 Tax=Cryptococcus wingfieldii CBS 7118 TaxID=1295528 RepID=A0A1E3HF26_9TREE|nr:hypothetical protein L198_08193 [Cryptococcus wingfieldii CBS 7118]ODN74942.1 hypothetical protein L198_08193 [Cryptococcus wingfieldii CBS 7118]